MYLSANNLVTQCSSLIAKIDQWHVLKWSEIDTAYRYSVPLLGNAETLFCKTKLYFEVGEFMNEVLANIASGFRLRSSAGTSQLPVPQTARSL